MRNLLRAIRMAFKYKYSLFSSLFLGFLVAALWGANIGALYPFVEIVFEGDSLHGWVDNRIEEANAAIAKNEKKIEGLRDDYESADSSRQQEINQRISRYEKSIEGERAKIASTKAIAPYIKSYMPDDAFQTLLILVVFFVGATLLRGVLLMCNMVLVSKVGQKTMLDLQYMFFRKALRMEMSEFDVNGTGDLVGRIRGETGAIAATVMTLFGKTVREPMKMGICFAGAAFINWRLLLFSMLICPAALWGILRIAKLTKKANKKAVEQSAKLLDRMLQAVTYLRIVKASNMEEFEQRQFEDKANYVYKKSMKISFYNALARVNNEMLGISIMCLSFVASGYLVLTDSTHLFGIRLSAATMSFGELMLFFGFLIGFSDPIRKMADVYNMIQGGVVAADRVFPLIDAEPNVRTPENPVAFPQRPPEVHFDRVCYAYRPGNNVLKQTKFKVAAGQTVAIVGANGCGKSTLINMLPRFFDPQDGAIRFDGTSIDEFDLRELRQGLGYVTQRSMLFNDTVFENIRYGCPDASLEQVQDAARQAMADDFIRKMPQGYESMIGEHGTGLSGGQQQRLTLARAILKDPKVLILDEATSQIDPKSENAIHQALTRFAKNRTTILITHRISSLSLADEIVVMDDGQVIDQGTHDELMSRCVMYQKIRNSHVQDAA